MCSLAEKDDYQTIFDKNTNIPIYENVFLI